MGFTSLEQTICDIILMYLSLLFTVSFNRTFVIVINFLQVCDVVISYYKISGSVLKRVRRTAIGCLIVMHPFLRDLPDRNRLENYLRNCISQNKDIDSSWIPNFIRGFYRPMMHYDCQYEGLLYLGLRLLLNAGANPNAVDEHGDNALLLLSRSRSQWIRTRCTSLLMKSDVDLNQVTCHGENLNFSSDGKMFSTNTPRLSCLAALAVHPDVQLRKNRRHIPRSLVQFVLQHHPDDEILYFDKFYRNSSSWRSSRIKWDQWKVHFLTCISTLVLVITLSIIASLCSTCLVKLLIFLLS